MNRPRTPSSLPAPVLPALVLLGALLAACSKPADTPSPPAAAPTPQAAAAPASAASGIAWTHAASDADVDAAFALARREAKPVFVYWGAQWCPPCNQVKATLFNRQDFIERSRAFVPVYVDGDSPGAQKLGTRFKVRGYPTMLLFDRHGTELTRLPGEVDAAQYTQVLTLGMNAQRPVKEVLAQARSGGAGLQANDWRLLAYYSWETDEQQLLKPEDVPAMLKQIAKACPTDQAETATRLRLKALAALDLKPGAKPPPGVEPADRDALTAVLADPARSRVHMDLLTNNAAELVRAVSATGTPERARMLAAFEAALKALEDDTTLSRADRMTAPIARTSLARIDADEKATVAMPEPLLADLRALSARFDREISDGYERQAVITTAAYALEHAGLLDESDALLKANLARSHSPYYLMSDLAGNARKRGDKAGALHWYEEAYVRSEGPATRLQWGAGYVTALVELSPDDTPRIERAVAQVFDEAGAMPDAFYERSGRSMERIAAQLQRWNRKGGQAAAVQRLQARLDAVCARLPADDPQRGRCERLMKPGARGKAA